MPVTGPKETLLVDFSITNITTSETEIIAELLAGTPNDHIVMAEIQTNIVDPLVLSLGSSGNETTLLHILTDPGNGKIPLHLASGTRLTLRTLSGTLSVGRLVLNFYG